MSKYVVTPNIEHVLAGEELKPTIVSWNRLEGRPRRSDFGRALKAEVRDPLWMITRQWQLGEFAGEDAGSPVMSKVAWTSDEVAAFHASEGGSLPYDGRIPLEALVEARPVPLSLAGRVHDVELRLALGRRWTQLLDANGHAGRISDFRDRYHFVAPDPVSEDDFPVTAHAAAWQTLAAVAGRALDGGALVAHLADGLPASEGLGMTGVEKDQIDDLGDELLAWASSLFYEPGDGMQSWVPRQLEYSSRLSAPHGESPAALGAPEYRGGDVDWFSFDAVAPGDEDTPGAARTPEVTSFFPAALQFEGMPNTRHWTFEEGATNFGGIEVDTTDVAKLLLIEFGLVYANDWFLLPIDLKVGSLASIEGLAVTNVFGERFWVEPSVTAGGPGATWRMFKLTDKGAADDRLFVPPTTPQGLESPPIEGVSFVRDEVANMVWGIETMVQLADGTPRRGREVALELRAKHQAAVPPPTTPPPPPAADLQYVLMTSVPENWIPFIPVHVDDDNREIQLQRAAMPRLLEGAEGIAPDPVEPRTRILREGMELDPPQGYFVAEEEVERAGTVVETTWKRCRWTNGEVVLWLGHRRTVGRGEGSSGLAFDTLVRRGPSAGS